MSRSFSRYLIIVIDMSTSSKYKHERKNVYLFLNLTFILSILVYIFYNFYNPFLVLKYEHE